jgi:hypothetical protein
MATTKEEIRGWLNQAKEQGATHLIIVCDTFDHVDFPLPVMPGQDARAVHDAHNGKNMERVMEVYNLSLDFELQLSAARVFNF